jgi:DNA-directed RNA polymerase specialized sigma24 family protein
MLRLTRALAQRKLTVCARRPAPGSASGPATDDGHLTDVNPIIRELREIARKLTDDPARQLDLLHEMFVHMVMMKTRHPDQSPEFYARSCESFGRERLRSQTPGRPAGEPQAPAMRKPEDNMNQAIQAMSLDSDLITRDLVEMIFPRLSGRTQEVFFLLLQGCGVRETARLLGITHPAVIKHRKKIARLAQPHFARGNRGAA